MGDSLKSIFDLIETTFWREDSSLGMLLAVLGSETACLLLTLESYLLDIIAVRNSFLYLNEAFRKDLKLRLFLNCLDVICRGRARCRLVIQLPELKAESAT